MARRVLWRITRRERAETAFTGKGAARYPGRWNERGTSIVYTAESLAGAVVNLLAYVQDIRSLETRVYFRVHVEEQAILDLDPKALPRDWWAFPYPSSTQRVGTGWQLEGASVGLRVPSVLMPETHNVLLNPEHPELPNAVRVEGPFSLSVDDRLGELLERTAEYSGRRSSG